MARFLHLSDLHVVPEGRLASGVLDTRRRLTDAIDRLNTLRSALDTLDAVLVSGDISDDGSAESYTHARAELDRLGLPIFVVPGNHDRRAPLRRAFADCPATPATGPMDWAVVIGDTRVIGLDSLVEGQGGGRLQAVSLSFLSETLSAAEAQATIVMLHHPPIRTGIRFMDAIGLENSDALAEVLKEAETDLLLIAGHVHGVYHGRLGRHRVAIAPSVCSAFALDRRDAAKAGFYNRPTGCAVIDTAPDGIWSALSLDPSEGPYPF